MKEFLPGFTLRRTRLRRNLVSVHGFTLIELLIVISIIGILSAVGLTTFPGVFARARDARRIEDSRDITKALQQFYSEKGKYPPSSSTSCNPGWCSSVSGSSTWIPDLSPTYIPSVPVDPVNTGGSPELISWYTTDSSDYCLQISQEKDATKNPNYRGYWNNTWKLRLGPYGPNGGLCGSR